MGHKKNERVTNNRNDVESEKRAPMSPKIDKHPAGIGVNRAEQCAQRIIETDNKNTRAQCLQKFRDEPHPEFFARADDKNGDEQNDEVALKPEEVAETREAVHVQLLSKLPRRFKSRQRGFELQLWPFSGFVRAFSVAFQPGIEDR